MALGQVLNLFFSIWSPAIAVFLFFVLLMLFRRWRKSVLELKRAAGRRPEKLEYAKCARCGYSLHGLEIPRCPECGTLAGFTKSLDELGLSDEEIRTGLLRRARHGGRSAGREDTDFDANEEKP